ncbi:hypothetical protein AAHC03_05395 [Spirometra sp. Aus1]
MYSSAVRPFTPYNGNPHAPSQNGYGWPENNRGLGSTFESSARQPNEVVRSPTVAFRSSGCGNVQSASAMRTAYTNRLSTTSIWDRALPKTPTKHVRYDPRPPPRYEDRTWMEEVDKLEQINHSPSSSEQSSLRQLVRCSDTSLTDYTSPASSVHLKEGWPEDVRNVSPHIQQDSSQQYLQQASGHQRRTDRCDNTSFRRAIQSMRSQGAQETSAGILDSQRNNIQIFLRNNQNNGINEALPTVNLADKILSPKAISSPISLRASGVGDPMSAKRVLVENYYTVEDSARTSAPCPIGTNMLATEKSPDIVSREVRTVRGSRQKMNGCAGSSRARGSNYSSAITSPTADKSSLGCSYGGSKSSGQPSPGSFVDELRYRVENSGPQEAGKRPVLRNVDYVACNQPVTPISLSYLSHHKSEMSLPTTGGGVSLNFHLSQGYRDRPLRTQQQLSTSSSTARLANLELVVRPPAALDSSNPAMRGGPSFRRLQSLYGNSTTTQKRYPSDNTLDKIYLTERAQPQYSASGRKAGTVKIQVRSRSAQASPSVSPAHSPRQTFKSSDQGYSDDRVRSQRTIVPTATTLNRTQSSPPRTDRGRFVSSNVDELQGEEEDFQTLPSVREIIRQVEEMTQKNCNSASLPRQPGHSANVVTVGNSQPSPSGHKSRACDRTTKQYEPQDSVQRRSFSQSYLQSGRQAASDAMNACQYSHMNAQNDDYDNPTVPNPPNSSFLPRRADSTVEQDSRLLSANATPFGARKADLLSNLPLDYQKLREAFLEQRREIQRLRKELAEKTRLIADLQRDIRLYEPWR